MSIEKLKEHQASEWVKEMVHWNECFIYEVKIIARNRGRDSVSPLGAYTHSGHGEQMEERIAEKYE